MVGRGRPAFRSVYEYAMLRGTILRVGWIERDTI
jgi:hypothetical protein